MKNQIVLGLGFGDEGKGTTVDYLTHSHKNSIVVKFSGGAQTAHNVTTPTGEHHTFSQFGSGTLNGALTMITQHALFEPLAFLNEAQHLYELGVPNPLNMVAIHENALLITLLHQAVTKKKEKVRGEHAHGSCGSGVWEANQYAMLHPESAPRVKDLKNFTLLEKKIQDYAHTITTLNLTEKEELTHETLNLLSTLHDVQFNIVSNDTMGSILETSPHNIFEGTQGTLLDSEYGFLPHVTGTKTTTINAEKIIDEYDLGSYETIGITRTYTTRHGYGPFPTETMSPSYALSHPEPHNKRGTWQGKWRRGTLDLQLLQHSLNMVTRDSPNNHPVDRLMVTHMDIPSPVTLSYNTPVNLNRVFQGREENLKVTELLKTVHPDETLSLAPPETIIDLLTRRLGFPGSFLVSTGPTHNEKKVLP